MQRVIITKKPGYTLGLTLCGVGLIFLLIVLWKAWPEMLSSFDPISALSTCLWTDYSDISLGVGLKPIHYIIVGVVMLTLGAVLVVRRRAIPVTAKVTVLLECPFCKNQWREPKAKGWGVCPYCGKLVHPRLVKTEINSSQHKP